MTTYYRNNQVTTTGWPFNTTWSTVSDTSTTNTGTYPQAGDTAIISANSAALTVTAANAACAYLTFTAVKTITFNGTLTISADLTLNNTNTFNGTSTVYVGGSIINTTRGTIAGTAPFVLNGTGTIAGVSWNNSMTINTAGTITFKSGETSGFGLTSGRTYTYTAGTVVSTNHLANFYGASSNTTINMSGMTWTSVGQIISGTLTLASDLNATNFYLETTSTLAASYDIVYNGNYNINCANLYGYKHLNATAGSFVMTAGYSLNVSTSITLIGSIQGTPLPISSSSAGTQINLAYSGTMANCIVYNTTFTDVNYTGVPLYAWYSAAPSNCVGIRNVTGANIGGGGIAITNY